MASDNKSLGRFVLDGVPPAPRGVPQIEVTFDIDANGILNVSAKDKATGKQQSIRIEGSSGLSKEEIERLQREAEVHAQEDRRKKEAVEVKNQAEQLIYATEKTMRELGDKVDAPIKQDVTEKIAALKEAHKGDDTEAIKKASEALALAAQKVGEKMYQQAPAGAPAAEAKDTVVEGTASEEKKENT